MKNIFSKSTGILLLALISVTAIAQKEVLLKYTYKPQSNYKTVLTTSSEMLLNFQGDEEFLKQLKSQGVKLPMEVASLQKMTTLLKVGEKKSNGDLGMTMVYEEILGSVKMNGMETAKPSPLNGVVIDGTIDTAGKMKIDSIRGELDPAVRQTLEATLQSIQGSIKFPEKPLKVGDKFSQDVPLAIPMAGGQPLKMVIRSDYKLVDIKDKKAQFDVVISVSLDMTIQQANMQATGNGGGKMNYDINLGVTTDLNVEMEMLLTMVMEKVEMTAKGKTKTQQVTSLE